MTGDEALGAVCVCVIHFILKVFNRDEVRAVCRTLEFFLFQLWKIMYS